jgi:hypothetical protein
LKETESSFQQCYQQHPLHHFHRYLNSRDQIHPVASPLWLTESGLIPTRSFFINHLHLFFDNTISSQSMRAGGATALAEHCVPPHIIQACGRWASDTFLIYIRKNPTLLQGFLFAHIQNQSSSTSTLPSESSLSIS